MARRDMQVTRQSPVAGPTQQFVSRKVDNRALNVVNPAVKSCRKPEVDGRLNVMAASDPELTKLFQDAQCGV